MIDYKNLTDLGYRGQFLKELIDSKSMDRLDLSSAGISRSYGSDGYYSVDHSILAKELAKAEIINNETTNGITSENPGPSMEMFKSIINTLISAKKVREDVTKLLTYTQDSVKDLDPKTKKNIGEILALVA